MNKLILSKLLKEAGSSFKEFEEAVLSQKDNRICYDKEESVISSSFIWSMSKQGHDYWEAVDLYVRTGRTAVSPKGEASPNCPITICGEFLEIGDHILELKHQKKLFKILAKKLGYEIQG